MSGRILSVFIDESGDFGPYEPHAPYYLVAMVLHDQKIDIVDNINTFEEHLINLGYHNHAIHTGPLIRRESVYSNDLVEDRKRLFNALFNGQIELTKILTSVFSTLYTYVEFRKVRPVDYKLFQVADLICTMELLEEKSTTNSFSRSELDFLGSVRDFKKNYLKHLQKKIL